MSTPRPAPSGPVDRSGDGLAYRVGRAQEADARALADVLAVSFDGYPWTSWIVPAEGHLDRLRALFGATVGEVGLPHGEVWVARARGTGELVGGVVALRLDADVPAEVWVRVGAAEAEVMADRLPAARAAEAATEGLRPAAPHLVLATTGVHPDHRRRGLASALLRPVAALADEQGLPTYLETSAEANLALYARAGFAVTGRVDVPGGGPTVWAMVREPAGR